VFNNDEIIYLSLSENIFQYIDFQKIKFE